MPSRLLPLPRLSLPLPRLFASFGLVFLLLAARASATEVNVTATTVLDAANDDYPQTGARPIGHVARSDCGATGAFYLDITKLQTGLYRARLMFHEMRPTGSGTTETVDTVDTDKPQHSGATLLYDSMCHPGGVRLWNNAYQELLRGSAGWTVRPLDLNIASVIGNANPVTLVHHRAEIAADDSLHVLFAYTVQGGGSGFVHAKRNRGGWTWNKYPPLENILSVALDTGGGVHVAYSVPDPISFAQELRYAKSAGAGWTTEAVLTPADIGDEVDVNPSIAIAPNGAVAIASTFVVSTGTTPSSANLRYNIRRGPNDWNSVVVASSPDGYLGTVSGTFTGGMPHLAYDSASRPHIAFTDIALSKDALNRPWLANGQLRYAFHNGADWEVQTLFTQPGPSFSPNPVVELLDPAAAVSPAGGRLAFLAVERKSFSSNPVYETGYVREFRALLISAMNVIGSDAQPSILDAILARGPAEAEMDQNADSAVDVADVIASLAP